MPKRQHPSMFLVWRITSSVGSTVVFLLVLEGVCRLTRPGFRVEERGRFREDFQIYTLLTEGVFQLDRHTFWRVVPRGDYGVNGQGLRDTELVVAEEYAPPADAHVVDLLPVLESLGSEAAALFVDDCHLTPRGHEIVARALFNAIEAHGLIQ